jgi:hypothetical protein
LLPLFKLYVFQRLQNAILQNAVISHRFRKWNRRAACEAAAGL